MKKVFLSLPIAALAIVFAFQNILPNLKSAPGILDATHAESKGHFSGFYRSLNSKTPHGYKIVGSPDPVRARESSERFELRKGDCSGNLYWDDCTNDRERTELVQGKPHIDLKKEHWLSWSFYIPKTYKNIYPVKVTLGQFHQDGATRPPIMFQNGPGGYWVDLNQMNEKHQLLIPEPELKGRWQDVVMQVKWSTGLDGFIRIWVNKNLKFKHNGQNLKSKGAIFFKYGIYRTFLSRFPEGKEIPDQVVYFDEVKWGRTRQEVELPDEPNKL